MLKKGIIQVYTGNGKGKTTAAFGLALRAIGRDLKVCFIQFIKGDSTDEGCRIALKNNENFDFASYGTGKFIINKPSQEDQSEAKKALLHAKKCIQRKKYNLVILDELALAVNLNLIELEEVIKIFKNKPENVELVITGRNVDPKIIELADLVTEMKKIKHPYDRGLQSREGIEF